MRILCMLLLFLSAFPGYTESESERLNRLGFQAYENRQYESALDLFNRAIEADGNNIYALHNAACVMALNFRKYDINRIIALLSRTIELNPGRIKKILGDADLDEIRKRPEFLDFILDNRPLSMSCHRPAPGSGAAGCEIHFTSDGIAVYYEVWEGGQFGDVTASKPAFTGRYAIQGNSIFMYLPGLRQEALKRPNAFIFVFPETQADDFIHGEINGSGKIEINGMLLY